MKRQQVCVHSSMSALSPLLLGVENNSEELPIWVWHYRNFRMLLFLKFLFCLVVVFSVFFNIICSVFVHVGIHPSPFILGNIWHIIQQWVWMSCMDNFYSLRCWRNLVDFCVICQMSLDNLILILSSYLYFSGALSKGERCHWCNQASVVAINYLTVSIKMSVGITWEKKMLFNQNKL